MCPSSLPVQVLPEVAAREAEEARAREAARVAAAAALAAGKKLPSQKVLEDSDSEEEPDLEMKVCVGGGFRFEDMLLRMQGRSP